MGARSYLEYTGARHCSILYIVIFMPDIKTHNQILRLAQGAIAGDKASFEEFYQAYLTPVYRYVLVRAKNKALAEDLTQAVFVKAFEHQATLAKEGAKPLAYLYTTARHALIDYWKKKKEVHQSDVSETFEKTADDKKSPDELAEHNDLSRELIAGLAQLTDEQREVVTLKYLHDYSVAEIAQHIGKSEEAVRQLQCRGLKALRAVIKV